MEKRKEKSELEEREVILRREIAELKIRLDIAYKEKQYWEEVYSVLFDEWNSKMNELYPTKLI